MRFQRRRLPAAAKVEEPAASDEGARAFLEVVAAEQFIEEQQDVRAGCGDAKAERAFVSSLVIRARRARPKPALS